MTLYHVELATCLCLLKPVVLLWYLQGVPKCNYRLSVVVVLVYI